MPFQRDLDIECTECEFLAPQIVEAADGTKTESLPTFKMRAYNGGVMRVSRWSDPVAVDLSGLTVPERAIPALYEHDPSQIVGHTSSIKVWKGHIDVTGVVSGVSQTAQDVAALGKRQFPWQASMGLSVTKVEHVSEGASAVVNGRTVKGPIDIARESTFREVSIVSWGADSTTSTDFAAKKRKNAMDEEVVTTTENNSESQNQELSGTATRQASTMESGDVAEATRAEIRRAAAEEHTRIAAINAKFAGHSDLAAKAISEGWDVGRQDAELRAAKAESLVASRPGNSISSFGISVQDGELFNDQRVIECALMMTAGAAEELYSDPLKRISDPKERRHFGRMYQPFTPQQIDFADKYFSNLGLQGALRWAVRDSRGAHGAWSRGNVDADIRASYSTNVLPTVFQNVLNRILIGSPPDVALIWPRICRPMSVNDFREVTKFRVHGAGHWEQYSATGDLPLGQIEEGPQWKNRVSTVGKFLQVAREDFINDDVGALNEIGTMMNRYGQLAPEIAAIRTLLANAGSFFSAGNSNLLTGATSAFGLDALKLAYNLYMKRADLQVTKDKREKKPAAYVDIRPSLLLVPIELEISAWELTNASVLTAQPATDKRASPLNFFANKFEMVSSPYLSDTNVHANASSTAYYLMSSPASIETISIAFLNGVQRPTIEMVEPHPQTLGMAVRGWFDFGVTLGDNRGAIRSDGA